MKNKFILLITFVLIGQMYVNGQEVVAKYKFQEAEKAFNESRYQDVLVNLEEVDKLIGRPAPNVLYLKVQTRDKMIGQDPVGQLEQLAKLQDDYTYYLKNFEKSDENKYMEVYAISERYNKQGLSPEIVRNVIAGDPSSACELGERCFASGQYKNAMNLLSQSAAKNYSKAYAKLGMMYYYGFGGYSDSVKARFCATEAAKIGDWWALIWLGENNKNQSDATVQFQKARPLVERAVSSGDVDAPYFMGLFYENDGTNLYPLALEWYQKTANANFSNFKEMAVLRAQHMSTYLSSFENAEIKFKEGNYDAAATEYMKANNTNYGNKKYLKEQIYLSYRKLADQFYQKNDYSTSLSVYEYAKKFHPDDQELDRTISDIKKKQLLLKEDDIYREANAGGMTIKKAEYYADLFPDGKYIKKVNDYLESSYMLVCSVWIMQNRYAEVKDYAEKYLKKFPDGKKAEKAKGYIEKCNKKMSK